MSIYVEECGDVNGPFLMFLHGGGVSGWMWRKQVEHFSDYYCVVPDLPEHGKSHSSFPFSIEAAAEACLSIIREKANGRVTIVVGFSLGAQILVHMLSMQPKLIHYAMINSALVTPQRALIKWLSPSIKLMYPLTKNRSFAKLQSKMLYISDEDFPLYFEESKSMKREALLRVLQENMSYSIPDAYAKAHAQLLVTVGEKEKGMMQESYRKLLSGNASFQGVVLKDVGHGLSLADAARFNTMLRSWIEQGTVSQ